ncbi:glycosyltransferase [Phyllobacterium salinisoli]|uniref:Glycosyltransferase n=1 Tax=Phyllobacterium salinisoli TaxID=1899321 RepID=A0A368K4M1_9HYPH|nr:glycosyltransferase family 2 protein [Phyllobacterium salinisoli]RCS23322.1 glycosyltransferase [Phyllobacterium salinisoli]
MQKRISVVTPFYNESVAVGYYERAIASLIAQMHDYHFEIVCVDDGSSDDTLEQLIAIACRDPNYVVVELSRNFGKEPALTAGLDIASGDAVIPFDADLQDPPEIIPDMVKAWEAGAEVVLARRSDRATDSHVKRKTAEWFYQLHNKVSRTKIPENVGDFRLMDRRVVDALKQLPERQRFMKGLFAWVGFKTDVIEYVRQPRSAGKTKFSGWRLWNLALEGMTGFSTVPLRIWTYIGLFGALISVAFAVFIVVRTILFGVSTPGYASLLVAVTFLGSLQLISIGIIGEYIGRIYLETKQRPNYLIRHLYRKS